MSTIVEEFGQSVLNYFISNYPENMEFKLSIDDYTFSSCAETANLDENELINRLQHKELYFRNSKEALAIAAFQVKIAGDVESVTASGSDGYYQKIRDNYPQYTNCKNWEIMNSYFKNWQIELWTAVKKLFALYKRHLDIPKDHSGPGRYVQYPVKAHEISNTQLLRYADTFIRRGLLPNQLQISYKVFCEMFFSRFVRESYRRTVWNFYCIWDGRSYNEIITRTKSSHSSKTIREKFNVVLEIDENEIYIYDKATGENIVDKKLIESFLYSNSNLLYFKEYDESGLYELCNGTIELDCEIVLLTEKELLIDKFTIRKIHQPRDGVILYAYICKTTKDLCSLLNLKIQEVKAPIKFLGGLKNRQGHYYDFALPIIEFSEEQSKAFINAVEVDVKGNRIYLEEIKNLLKSNDGTYTLKLPDYIPVKFKIDRPERVKSAKYDISGWSFQPHSVSPANIEDGSSNNINGFCANFDFTPIQDRINDLDENFTERKFIQQINRFECRFLNKTIKERLAK